MTTSKQVTVTKTNPKKKQKLGGKSVLGATTTTSAGSTAAIINDVPANVSDKIDRSLIERAMAALLKHHIEVSEKEISKTGKLPLLVDSDTNHLTAAVQVQFGLEVAPTQKRIKPIRIHIPHSIYQLSSSSSDDDNDTNSIDDAEICFIVKDDTTKTFVTEMKEQFPQYMTNIRMVLTLTELRQKYSEFSQRRLLLSQQYTHFIADDRILPMLTAALGKDFISAKKQPIPIKVTRKDVLPHAIQKAICHATYLFIPDGTCITIRVGYTSQSITHLVDNIVSIVQHVPPKIVRQWANIRSINIKLPTSIALPIYNQTPSELMDIATMAGLPTMWTDQVEDDREHENDSKKKMSDTTTSTAIISSDKTKKKKSPLLKALEKQKHDTHAPAKDDDDDKKIETRKTKNKKRKKDITTNNDDDDDTNKKEMSASAIATTPTSSASKKVKSSGVSTTPITTVTAKMKATIVDSTSTSTATNQKVVDNKKKSFIAAKKFQGPKHGYVFHVGPSGLGYYMDQPPRPSAAVMMKHQRRSTVSPRTNNKNNKKTTTTTKRQQRRSR